MLTPQQSRGTLVLTVNTLIRWSLPYIYIYIGSQCCSQVADGGCRVKFDTMLGFDWKHPNYHLNFHLKDNDNHWHRIEEDEALRDVCACQLLPLALAQIGSVEDPIPI